MSTQNDNLEALYGLNPHSPHPALMFPRLPPIARAALGHPETALPRMEHAGVLARREMDLFLRSFRDDAKRLLDGSPATTTHPLSAGRDSLTTLQAENERLQKENGELRRRLEEIQDSRLQP